MRQFLFFFILTSIALRLMVPVFSVTPVQAGTTFPGKKVTALLQQATQPIQTAMALPAVSVSTEEAARHLIGEQPIVRIKTFPAHGYFYDVIHVDVMVDRDGAVLWAAVALGSYSPKSKAKVPFEILQEAESVVRNLRFNQFRLGGISVRATFQMPVTVLPPELKPARHIPIPQVKKWKSVNISLSRVGCFGFCPAYNLEVHGDGSIFYQGRAFVAIPGQQYGSVPRENIAELLSILEQADFYSLRNRYGACGLDGADAYLSVEIEGRRKEVKDCEGEWYGMPHSVRRVEEAIDRLSGAESWIHPNPFMTPDTLGALQR